MSEIIPLLFKVNHISEQRHHKCGTRYINKLMWEYIIFDIKLFFLLFSLSKKINRGESIEVNTFSKQLTCPH